MSRRLSVPPRLVPLALVPAVLVPALLGAGTAAAASTPSSTAASTASSTAVSTTVGTTASTTVRASVTTGGAGGESDSTRPSISDRGDVVAFSSYSTLDPAAPGAGVFVRDLRRGSTTRVDVRPGGGAPDEFGDSAHVSGDGRHVAFVSPATDLVAGTRGRQLRAYVRDLRAGRTVLVSPRTGQDVYGVAVDRHGQHAAYVLADGRVLLRDLVHGTTRRVDVTSAGTPGTPPYGVSGQTLVALSDNGRYVAFASAARLAAGRYEGVQLWRHDVRTGRTVRVGQIAYDFMRTLSSFGLSGDGRWVTWATWKPDNVDGSTVVRLRDVSTGRTTLVSRGPGGALATGTSTSPSISRDGRWVAYSAEAGDLVAGDTNGVADVLVYDRQTRRTVRASVSSQGVQADAGTEFTPSATAVAARPGGGWVAAFQTEASTLAADDDNGANDVYVRTTP